MEELEEIDGALNDLETGVRAGGPGGDAFKSCECEQYQDCPVVNRCMGVGAVVVVGIAVIATASAIVAFVAISAAVLFCCRNCRC